MALLRYFFLLCALAASSLAHECYVCAEQDSNRGKCTETVEPCDFEYDHCLSEIRWSSTPYWEIGAPMQYYINKRCAKKSQCEEVIAASIPYCDHIWWKDWKCAECCKGDRCNYYVTLGSSSVRSSWLLLLMPLLLTAFLV